MKVPDEEILISNIEILNANPERGRQAFEL
jgi:hypothetical protein